jgi:hypothetical protein
MFYRVLEFRILKAPAFELNSTESMKLPVTSPKVLLPPG